MRATVARQIVRIRCVTHAAARGCLCAEDLTMRICVRFWLALASAAVIVPPAVASTKSATKAYKSLQAAALKEYRAENDGRMAFAFAQIGVAETALKAAQISAPNAVEDVVDALGPMLAEVSVKALLTTVDLAGAADNLLVAEGVKTLPGFLPGAGGLGDQFEQKIDKELARVRGKTLKRLGQFRKVLAKATGNLFGLTFVVPVMHVNGAPTPNNPITAGPNDADHYSPCILIALGTSSTAVDSDGQIVVGARGFLSNSDISTNFYVDGPETKWEVDVNEPDVDLSGYSQAKFSALEEGGYRVFFDQDPDHDAAANEVEFERATIGVP
jgi:hypothetical protein